MTYMGRKVTEIDLETRELILMRLFQQLLTNLHELPLEIRQVVLAKMLEGE